MIAQTAIPIKAAIPMIRHTKAQIAMPAILSHPVPMMDVSIEASGAVDTATGRDLAEPEKGTNPIRRFG